MHLKDKYKTLPGAGEKIALGLSGGVDSAVAAHLLKRAGCEVLGLYMKNWEEDDAETGCAAAEDLRYVEALCARLDIPLRTVNFATEYWDRVFRRFLDEYAAGRTPNPDVLCNREIKFGAFCEYAQSLGAARVATGHYAGVAREDGAWRLLKGADADKDQSYFLHQLDQGMLARAVFPLADMRKSEVRALAKAERLPGWDRKDSSGLCFIGERHFRRFLSRHLPCAPGDIVDEAGRVLGRHQGAALYTIGQREGLGLGGGPWHVARKDAVHNRLTVVHGRDSAALRQGRLQIEAPHWIAEPPAAGAALAARCRHRQPPAPCRARRLSDDRWEVAFDAPQWAPAPGQFVVLYAGRRCLGGGAIAE